MALYNLNDQIAVPNWDTFARPVTVTPTVSQPGGPAYGARGYYDVKELDVFTEAGAPFSSGQAYLDILIAEFPVLPMQGDTIDIPFHQGAEGGSFQVSDLSPSDAKGMITVNLHELKAARPPLPIP